MINQPNSLQSTTQKYLELFDITNDVIILQDGTISMVMQSTAINFDLYSEEEQDAAIYAYAALLNSLSFPIEIVIRSQKKDVTSYLDLLKHAEMKSFNPISRKNIKEYREFVAQLVQERNVLEKKFYIIISYTALEAGLLPGSSLLPGMNAKNKKSAAPLDKAAILEKSLTNLEPRRDHLMHQFARIGLFLRQVKTQELIQLFYTIYNPDGAKGIRVGEAAEYSSPVVNADLPPEEMVHAQVPATSANPSAAPVAPSEPTITPLPQPVPIPEMQLPPTPPAQTPMMTQEIKPMEAHAPIPQVTEPKPMEAPTPPPVEVPMAPVPPTSPTQTVFEANPALKEDTISVGSDLTPPIPPATPASGSSTT
ncbi:MAG: hypothetical protein ABI758_05010 [Candidatus Woesebacteria bacterium]